MPDPLDHGTLQKWVKIVSAAAVGIVIYTSFGSSEKKPVSKQEGERAAAAIALRNRMLDARLLCHEAVKATSKYPTKASFESISLERGVSAASDGGLEIVGRVELMNGLGALIPHSFRCSIDPAGQLRLPFAVSPG